MMLNPANARLAAKLPRLAADSPEAQSIMKSLFKTGLRGLRFELQTSTGQDLDYLKRRVMVSYIK